MIVALLVIAVALILTLGEEQPPDDWADRDAWDRWNRRQSVTHHW